MRFTSTSAALLAVSLPVTAATAQTLVDFDDTTNRAPISPDMYDGLTITGYEPGFTESKTIIGWDYDGNPGVYPGGGGHQEPFTVGNAAGPDYGNGIALSTDDYLVEGDRPAGDFLFEFDAPIDFFSFVIIDVEGPVEFETDSGFFIDFESSLGESLESVFFGDLISEGGEYYDPSIEFGNGSANLIAFSAEELGLTDFSTVKIALGGSATIAEIEYETYDGGEEPIIPTPAALPAGALMLAMIGLRRRRLA